jgi:hypothetical protein
MKINDFRGRRLLSIIFIGIAVLVFLFALENVSAQAPTRPLAMTYNASFHETAFSGSTPTFRVIAEIAVPYSHSDPTGSMEYCIWRFVDENIWTPISCTWNDSPHTGWKNRTMGISGVLGDEISLIVSVNNTGGTGDTLSTRSCRITLTYENHAERQQCGLQPFPVPGLSGVVTARTVPGSVGTLEIRWKPTLDETYTPGNWSYWIRAGAPTGTQLEETELGQTFDSSPVELSNFVHYSGSPIDGVYVTQITPTGLGLSWVWISVSAQADDINWWANGTACAIGIRIDVQYAAMKCGNIEAPETQNPTVTGIVTTPQFPLVNVSQFAGALGVPVGIASAGLGFVIIGSAVVGGYVFGGAILAVAMVALAVGATVALRLIPSWWLVLVFMTAFGAILFMKPKGGGTE